MMPTITLRAARRADGAPARLRLRSLRGDDELAIDGVDTRSAVRLLERLVEDGEDRPPVDALCASDRDRLLATVHRQAFGDTISASPACASCGARYDVSFSLAALQRHLDESANGPVPASLPSGRDEISAGECAWDDGIAQLRRAADGAAAEALDVAAPLLDLELEARCPECQLVQEVGFDVQSFLLGVLLAERPLLMQEIHLLASTYHWGLPDILALTRTTRRALVAAVDDERTRRLHALRSGWR